MTTTESYGCDKHGEDAYQGCAMCDLERLTAENAALKAQLAYAASTGDECEVEGEALRKDAERYRWLANRVLACDYGDNDEPGEQIGWRIRHDLIAHTGQRQPAFMFGPSIDAAIDAAMGESHE